MPRGLNILDRARKLLPKAERRIERRRSLSDRYGRFADELDDEARALQYDIDMEDIDDSFLPMVVNLKSRRDEARDLERQYYDAANEAYGTYEWLRNYGRK